MATLYAQAARTSPPGVSSAYTLSRFCFWVVASSVWWS